MLYFANSSLEVSEALQRNSIRRLVPDPWHPAVLSRRDVVAYAAEDAPGSIHAAPCPLRQYPASGGNRRPGSELRLRVATGFLHEFSGFVVFAIGFAILWGMTIILRRREDQRPKAKRIDAILARRRSDAIPLCPSREYRAAVGAGVGSACDYG